MKLDTLINTYYRIFTRYHKIFRLRILLQKQNAVTSEKTFLFFNDKPQSI